MWATGVILFGKNVFFRPKTVTKNDCYFWVYLLVVVDPTGLPRLCIVGQ